MAALPGGSTSSAAADLLELLRRLRSLSLFPDLDHHPLSSAFDRVFLLFFSQVLITVPPPLPPMLGEGRHLDLFSLYSAARLHHLSWPRAAASLSLRHPGASSALKLLYSKYLHSFHRWLSLVLDRTLDDAPRVGSDVQCDTPKPDPLSLPSARPNLPCVVVELGKTSQPVASAKRNKSDLIALLQWMKRIARGPVVHGSGSERDGKAETGKEFHRVVLARKALLVKRPVRIGTGIFLSQRSHPSMYDDPNNMFHRADENVRYSRRILSKHSVDDSESSAPSKRLKSCSPDKSPDDFYGEGSMDDPCPKWRAKVPDLSDCKINSEMHDLKWLGTQIWPSEIKDGKIRTDQSSIGKGREDSCTCKIRGSVECVRFHVAENRLRVKCELNKAFYQWKFQQMGEEISLSWTAEEEDKFNLVVRLRAQSPEKYFWGQLFESFPSKSRCSLVSYYFNVYLVRRRSYQNRVTPSNIDSDDEEGEFGFVSSCLGSSAVETHGAQKVICAENRVAIDLDAYIDLDSDMDNVQ